MKKTVYLCVIIIVAVVVILFLANKIAEFSKKECKILDGKEICGEEIETEDGTETTYTTNDGKTQVIERRDDEGILKQTETKKISEDRECIEIKEPGEDMPMMGGCRSRNQV